MLARVRPLDCEDTTTYAVSPPGEVNRCRPCPWIAIGETRPARVDPPTLRMRTSAWNAETWWSTAIVVGVVQPMSRIRLVPEDSHPIGSAREEPMTRPSESYRIRLTTIRSADDPRSTAMKRE